MDRTKYPKIYSVYNTKIIRNQQEKVMTNIHSVTEEEMAKGTEEIFLDFRREENAEIGKLEIKVKDRRNEYP